jgi:[protein-PII] uridylyltransferase
LNTVAAKSPAPKNAFSSPEEIRTFKERIQQNNADLIRQFHAAVPIAKLIQARADFIDDLLTSCWHRFLRPFDERLALVAVGGYGRHELHPHSDIDILVLLDCQEHADNSECQNHKVYEAALAGFFSFLWDIGLKPGQSVGTVDECAEEARRDQTVITNLMESRLLSGSSALFEALSARINPDHMWPSAEFFTAKLAEQRARYAKYHDTAYNLEPNVKEGPGGLRDIQLIRWIIKRHYNNPNGLSDLVTYGWLTESEFNELINGRAFLWKVRFALHALTQRNEDRLLFDHQKALAHQFGFQGSNTNEVVEQFMQQYFRTVMALERLNEMLLQLFREVMLNDAEDVLILPINRSFQAVNSYVEVTHAYVFRDNPLALLEIFLILQQNASLKGIRAATIRLIRQHVYLIDEKFRNDRNACKLFMDILRQPEGITHQLRRMNRYGVLAAYLPPFANVVGRMQYDLFHVYTVDEHSLFVVRNLRRFAVDKYYAEHPFCSDIFKSIAKPELLYIAALMHDIAKGRGGDHSVLGENIAEDFCRRHGLSEGDTRLVKWLVRHHLIMSMTAQRRDISDPEVVHQFATLVGSEERLNYIYLLTVADIRATNPNLWNSWRDALLKELYTGARRALRRGLDNPIEQADKIKTSRCETRYLLGRLGIRQETIDRVWQNVSDEYFLRYSPEEIVWHTIAIASCKPEELPLVLLRPINPHGSAEVFLYTTDQDFSFAHSAAVLDQLGFTIFDARIITSNNGYVLNSYLVLEQSGAPIIDLHRQLQLCAKLKECLLNPNALCLRVGRRERPQVKHFAVKTQVYFHADSQNRYTILELLATDRPGLLSKVGQAFNQHGIRIYNAKITTIGSRAEDIFYITDQYNRPLERKDLRAQLEQSIIALVGER